MYSSLKMHEYSVDWLKHRACAHNMMCDSLVGRSKTRLVKTLYLCRKWKSEVPTVHMLVVVKRRASAADYTWGL